MDLRPYQANAVRELRARFKKHKRIVAVAPTGSGKTTIAAAFVKSHRGRVLWLAHRRELLFQAKRELIAAGVPAKDIGILTGTESVNEHACILLASIQIKPERDVSLIVVDEAHRIQAETYQVVLESCPDALVLGLTATPERLDGQPLSDTFSDMLIVAESVDLIAARYIAKPICYGLPRDKAREIVKGLQSDRDFSRAMRNRTLMGDTVKECQRLAPNERTIVFAVDREHGQALTKRFGAKAEYLDGETPSELRKAILARLAKGVTQVVVNVDVLSEGIDIPSVKCIALCRPTKSLTRYLQQVGRGARMYKGKRPIILDHAGNIWRHGFPEVPRAWSLNGREKGEGLGNVAARLCPECSALNALAARECVECGAEMPRTETELEEHEAELQRLEESKAFRKRLEAFAKEKIADKAEREAWIAKALGAA
jgi:superfamily II DNA or RNA helicase